MVEYFRKIRPYLVIWSFLLSMKINNLYKEKENTEIRNSMLYKVNGESENLPYELINEHLMKVYINEREVMSLVCKGANLVELVVGRIISEGIVKSVDDIESIYIYAKKASEQN